MIENKVSIMNESGSIKFRDINQEIILENLGKNLDNLNKVWVNSKYEENNIISSLLTDKIKVLDISKHNLYFKNTFFKSDKIYFEDIYVPLDIQIDKKVISLKNNKPLAEELYSINDDFLIENIFQRDKNSIINIVGGAGQGKSTVLCKIFINQLKKGNLIPIYLSFRNIDNNIVSKIIQIFEDNGIPCGSSEIVGLLRSKKILLIIDAFDEISDELLKSKLINEINRMNNTYGVSIICSSRPGTKLCFQSNVKNYELCDLSSEKADEIIEKTLKIYNYQSEKILHLLNEENGIKNSLKTPLLAVLFVKIYPEMDIIPEHARDFYDQIFFLLHSGHDKYKDGSQIHRNLVAKYSRDNTRLLFSLFCFITFINNQSSFIIDNADRYLKAGVNHFKTKISEEILNINTLDFLQDIIDCTSLLVIDGVDKGSDYYTFLHKTIQEYHAAIFFRDFIKQELSEEKIDVFINKFIDEIFLDSSKIMEFIKFYSVIDKNFSKKKILYPFLSKYFFETNKNREENIENCANIIFENYLKDGNLHIHSKLEKIEESTKVLQVSGLKYSNSKNKEITVFTRDEGTLQLNLYSTLRETFISIAYIYGMEEKVKEKFDELIGITTEFATSNIFPIKNKDIDKLRKGEIIHREMKVNILDLLKNKGYSDNYKSILNKLKELSELIFDDLYLVLKADIAKMEQDISLIDSSIEDLFSLN
ncbi:MULTISPECIES: NACHT domain-containing protein [unclassified Acinetobacter]|uniref:NACHT domain-containing protein n=1 Tax=unclassified Acinetobacter TaxID=196816 RepID=UPI0025764D01|nr:MULTISPECIES: NACHT domain-containing protein [unclassified Acinetobacter]MDM1766029.1 NACHT domain-containing protein [Acinetobacter sp. 226-1]MDM1769783.1 NACHT domain-containing protein [Acinetobacter sp. 226-4]